jgi:hypothetical protein
MKMITASLLVVALALVSSTYGQDYPNIPGFDFVGAGFDGTTMQPRGLPIIELTYDDEQTYTNPIYNNLNYMVSDNYNYYYLSSYYLFCVINIIIGS